MITIQHESFEQVLEELKPMLDGHWRELAMDQDRVPLVPNFDLYVRFEQVGQLIFSTIREDGVLKGYFIGFVIPGMHYSTCLECKMDIFYVHPSIRAQGLPGLKLFREVEKELKRRGVQRWFVGSKIKADASGLFKRMGFKPIEVYHSKWIGD